VNTRYDLVIIGSGAGGGTMAHALARSGRRILVLERGGFVPREEENWSPEAVWKHLRYRADDRWTDARGEVFLPYTHYGVGGNTKFWGSVLYRLRREDFQEVEHVDGRSTTTRSRRTTTGPSASITCTASTGSIRPSRAANRFRTHPFRTRARWRRSSRTSGARGCIRLRCRSA
jgi:choline dehydrogenase-like flavoprotein